MGEPLQAPDISGYTATYGHRAVPVEQYLSTKEAASRLGVAEITIRNKVKQGLLHPVKRKINRKGRGGPRHVLAFNPDEIENEFERLYQRVRDKLNADRPSLKQQPTQPPQPSGLSVVAAVEAKPEKKPGRPPTNKNDDRASRYDPEEGERCAHATSLLLGGKQQLDLVVEMKISFELANHYWQSFLAAKPYWALPGKNLEKLRSLIGWDEEEPTVDGFERALKAHVASMLAAKGPQEKGIEMSAQDRAGLAALEAELTPPTSNKG